MAPDSEAINLLMNMIVCDKKCTHQKDGYCGLNRITSLSAEPGEKCGYFERNEPQQRIPGNQSTLPEHMERL